MRTATNHFVRNNGCPRRCMAGKDRVRVLPQISHVKMRFLHMTVVTHMLRSASFAQNRQYSGDVKAICQQQRNLLHHLRPTNSESGEDSGATTAFSGHLAAEMRAFPKGTEKPESEAWL
jgi:hypothetical protein